MTAPKVKTTLHIVEAPATDLLADVEAFLSRFVAFPNEHALVAVTLWAVHAHAVQSFESTPRLFLGSTEPGSGKTRTQELLELLVPRPLFSLNTSSAALFRMIGGSAGPPTVLLDEADTIFGPKASKDHEDLRGFVNAGHRRGAKAHRCVTQGSNVVVVEFPAFAAVCIAGLDDLPETIMARSVVIRMRRRAPHERVEPFRHRVHGEAGLELRDRLVLWAAEHGDALADAWPDMPEGIEDRNADVWEALFAIADQVGGTWPNRARVAAVALVADIRREGGSLNVRLLKDLRTVFGNEPHLSTESVLHALNALDESPWGNLRGSALDARGLARRLVKFDVRPKNMRSGGRTVKGYARGDLLDPWARYLPPPLPSQISATSATSATSDLPEAPDTLPGFGIG